MADKFQDIRHKHSTYDRPNEGWVCGNKCTGCPCFLGPDRSGKCRAGAEFDGRRSGECLPRRSGGRWLCTRMETHGGEACAKGPLPDGSCCQSVAKCQPKPTLRRLRGMVTLVLSVVTVAGLCVILGRDSGGGLRGAAALNPGPLSSMHSTLEARCHQCHSNMNVGPSRLLEMHSSRFDHRAIADSKLCLDCHQEIGGSAGRYAFSPHTMDPTKLHAKTRGESKPDPMLRLASFLVKDSSNGKKELACGTCHQEHRGLEGNLKTFTNRQCQICHQQQFESFSHGHPEFESVSYPANRRTRIYFDHVGHYSLHFVEKSKEAPDTVPAGFKPESPHSESVSCASCHASNGTGGASAMNVVSFEKACAACHDNDTRSGNKLPVIGYPQLDVASLNTALSREKNPRSLGAWPTDAPNDFPWLLLYLLPEDARTSWQRLAENKIFMYDLSGLRPELAGDAERVSWGIKELFRDLCTSTQSDSPSGEVGHAELLRRLRLAGCDHDSAALINGLPPDVFDMFRQFMGPELCMKIMTEVDDYRARKFPEPVKPEPDSPKTPDPAVPAAPAPGSQESFGAATQGESFGAPTAATPAPAASESFGAPTAATPAPAAGESFGAPTAATPAPAASESFGAPTAATPAPAASESFGVPVPTAGENFSAAPVPKPALAGESFSATPAPAGENFGTPATAPSGGESFTAPSATTNPPGTEHSEHPPSMDPVDRENWSTSGGWHQEYGVIYYKSTGHADPLLKAWLEHVLEDVKDPLRLATLREGFGFSQGTLSPATGHCLKCHTIDEQRDGQGKLAGALINWSSYGKKKSPAEDDRPLTHYNHMAHLLFADCRRCHSTNVREGSKEKYAAAFPGEDNWDPDGHWFKKADVTKFHGNFEQISKSTCADCHTAKKTGDNCLQCHRYHHPAPDGAADMLKWLRFRESRPSSASDNENQPSESAALKVSH